MLRVDGQSFSVVAFCLLWALSQRAKIVHGTGMLRVQPEDVRRQEERRHCDYSSLPYVLYHHDVFSVSKTRAPTAQFP